MKKVVTPFIKSFVSNKYTWKICSLFMRIAEWFRYEKSCQDHLKAEQVLITYFKDLVVTDGFFKGLKYPGFSSFGSSLFPKLSGTYENELKPIFEKIQPTKYNSIVDIGSAEGFYANGLALKFPQSNIYAFDIEEVAQQLCKEMSVINGIDKRVFVNGICTNRWLGTFDFEKKSLIICDCEGFEIKLFDDLNVTNLSNCDLIIEMHPMFEREVKHYLIALFENTHHLEFISSFDDARKIFDLPSQYASFNNLEKIKLVQEGRAFTMEWMIAFANTNIASSLN
jgi:hypothetical protein